MKRQEFTYIAGNDLYIAALSDSEIIAFFSALLAGLKELGKEEKANNSFCLSSGGA